MEWWGYLLSGMAVWLVGFVAGKASGIALSMRQIIASQAVRKEPDLASLIAAGGLTHAEERQGQGN